MEDLRLKERSPGYQKYPGPNLRMGLTQTLLSWTDMLDRIPNETLCLESKLQFSSVW
jgi:hypothetical protein